MPDIVITLIFRMHLLKIQVICCTCAGAGSPILKSHRFKYVLIDEAAHAAEPVSLIPLALGAEIICLIGDEKQLRPFVKSAHAAELKQSLFERYSSTNL